MGVDALIDPSQKEVLGRCNYARHEGVFPDNCLYVCDSFNYCKEKVFCGGLRDKPYCGIELRRKDMQPRENTADIRQAASVS